MDGGNCAVSGTGHESRYWAQDAIYVTKYDDPELKEGIGSESGWIKDELR